MGSLGFLTPFSYENYTTDIIRVLNGKYNSCLKAELCVSSIMDIIVIS